MKLVFMTHARKRMSERAISSEEIREVIEFPDYTVRKDCLVEPHKPVTGRALRIVYVRRDNYIEVITVIER